MSSTSGQGISPQGFLAVLWTLTAVATILLVGRFIIRFISLSRFHLDDAFSAAAWFLMLVAVICQTLSNDLTYQISAVLVGDAPMPPPQQFAAMNITLRRWDVAGQMLFWTSIFCVKFAFMSLYRLILGDASSVHKKFWCAGMIYIILCYGICLIGVFGQCGDARNLWTIEQCMTPYVAALDAKLIWVDYFFNVSSDLLLMVLPMPLIWILHIRPSQKIAVSAVWCLALITIAFETLRTVKLYQETFELTSLYSYLEFQIAVIVGILPSYRFLISNSEKNREYRHLFWSMISFRGRSRSRPSEHSDHSDHSMQNYANRSSARASQSLPKVTEGDDAPPLPAFDKASSAPSSNAV